MNDELIYFIHIPKTGGMSISNMIRAHRDAETVWDVTSDGVARDIPPTFVMGHFWYGRHAKYPRQRPVYITILRDPVERLWSHYHAVLRRADHYLHQRAVELGPAAYIMDRSISWENDNTATRMISGRGYYRGWDTPVTADDLDLAIEHLRQFRVVGLHDHFAETARLIYGLWGWTLDPIRHDNLGTNKPATIPDDVREVFEAASVYDRQLYAVGRRLFLEQVERVTG